MKRILKRIGSMILVLTLFFQVFGTHVYAAPNTVSGNSVKETETSGETITDSTYIEPVTGIEIPDIRDEVEQYIDDSLISWIEENIPDERSDLENKSQEWWDSLSNSQRRIAEILLSAARAEKKHYNDQPLDEVIKIIESGQVSIEKFFEGTILENITIENLYELRELKQELADLEEAIYGILGYEGYLMPETDEMLILAITVSGYSPFTTFASDFSGEGSGIATGIMHPNTKDTGYTDGKGNTFWQITDSDGKNVYCLDHGLSCSRRFEYGNMTQISGPAAWLIQNYGQATSTTEGYMCYQMAVWALQAGETKATVYDYALGWYIAGGVSARSAAAWAETVVTFFSMAVGKSGSCYAVSGPPGSQRLGKPDEFLLTGTPGEPTPPEEAPEPIIVDVPSIDNFYIEKEARTEYHVELTKESIITNETLEGFQFRVVESEADGHDLTYDFITGEYAKEGQDYEEATIGSDSFGQTTPESITVPYMDDDVKPSGGAHETTITTNENGYAETTFVHEATFKEFYSICYDQSLSEIDYASYQAMLDAAIATISGAAGAEIIVNYRGGSETMDQASALELCNSQITVYTQTVDEATQTIEELYEEYCDRTYKYTVTEIDGYTRKSATDSNGKVLPEIKLPKLGFRKNVKDATTISSYTKTLADGQTMVAGGKNDADSNTEERNITNEPWYNQIFINKTDLETGSQILYDTEFEIYEYYQYKAKLSPTSYKLYPAKILKGFMAEQGSAFVTDTIKSAKLIVKNAAGSKEMSETLDRDQLIKALKDTSSYVVNFNTTHPGEYKAELVLTLNSDDAIGSAMQKKFYGGFIEEVGSCDCTEKCTDEAKATCPVCSLRKDCCTPNASSMKVYDLYTKELKTEEIVVSSMDETNGKFTTADGREYTFTKSVETSGTPGEEDYKETEVTTYSYTDANGESHSITSKDDLANIITKYKEVAADAPEGTEPEVDSYTLTFLVNVKTDVKIFDDGNRMMAKDSERDYVKAETDESRNWVLYYYLTEPLASGDYAYESEFLVSASSISVKSIDKNVKTDKNDYTTWGQDNYEIVRVTADIAKEMGWSDTTIGMYTVHRLSALDQYTGTTFTDHHDESDKSVKYGYNEYGTLYFTQANQGKFAIIEKQAPRDGSKTGYLGNFEDREYTKLSEQSKKKNHDGAPYATDDQMSVVKMVHYIDLCTDTNQYATYMLTDGYREYDAEIYNNYVQTIKNDRGEDVATEDGYDAHYFDQSSLHETIALENYRLNNPMNDVLNSHWDAWFSDYMTHKSGINVLRDSKKTDAWMDRNTETNILHHFVGTTINIDSYNDNDSSQSDISYNGTYTDTKLNYGTFAGEMADSLNKRTGFNKREYLQVGDVTYDNAAAEKEARFKNTEKDVNKDALYAFIDEREYGYIRFTKYDADAERYVTGDLDEKYEAGTDHADADLDGAVYSLYVDESNTFDVTYLEGKLSGKLFWAQPLNAGGYRVIYDGDGNESNGFTDKGDNPYEDYAHAYITKDGKFFLDYNDDASKSVAVVKKNTTYHGIQHPDGQYGGAKHNGFFAVMEEQQVFVDTNQDGYSDTWTLQDVTLYAGAKMASAAIQDGELEMNGLYLGNYYLAEEIRDAITIYSTDNDDVEAAENRWLSFAAGYTADTDAHGNPTKYYFDFPYVDKNQNGTDYKAEQDYVHKNTDQVSNQQVVKGGSAQFNKITTNGESSSSGNTTGEALEGAGFSVFMLSELSLIKDGTIVPAYGEVDGHELVEANRLVKLFDAAGNMVGYEHTKSYLKEADLYGYFDEKYPEGYKLEDVNRLIFVKDRGYYYVEDILAAYRNDFYDNETRKWDFSAEDEAIVRIYEEDEDYITKVNKDYAYVENHLNAGSPCEFYGVNGLSDGWVATGVKNEYKLAEIFSNHYGSVRVPELAWGAYLLVETTTPEDVFTADPVFFSVTDTSASENRSKKVTITDTAVVSSLILIKRDAQSGQDVKRAGTSYRIWDYTNNCYVSKYLLGENGALSVVAQRVFTTDKDGRINAVASLECGKYRIEELSGPNGYHNTYWDYGNGTEGERLGGIGKDAEVPTEDNMFQKYYGTKDFEVTTDRKYRASGIVSSDNLDYLYIGEYFYNDELVGKLNITKTGEVLVGYKNTDDIEYADEYRDVSDKDFNYSKSMMRERSVFESMKDHYDLGTDEVVMRDVVIDGLKISEIIPVSHIAYDKAGMGIAAIYTDENSMKVTMNGGLVYENGVRVTLADGTEEIYPGAILETPTDLFVYALDGKYLPVKAVEEPVAGADPAEIIFKYFDLDDKEITDENILKSLKAGASITKLDGTTEYVPAEFVKEISSSDGFLMIVYENSTDYYENAALTAVTDTFIYTVKGNIMDTSYLVTEKDGILTTNDYGTLKEEADGTYTLTFREAIYDPDINYNYKMTLSDGSTKDVKLVTGSMYLSKDNELITPLPGGGYKIEDQDGVATKDQEAFITLEEENTGETFDFVYEERPLADATYVIKAAEDIKTLDNGDNYWFRKGDVVATVTTANDGEIVDFAPSYNNGGTYDYTYYYGNSNGTSESLTKEGSYQPEEFATTGAVENYWIASRMSDLDVSLFGIPAFTDETIYPNTYYREDVLPIYRRILSEGASTNALVTDYMSRLEAYGGLDSEGAKVVTASDNGFVLTNKETVVYKGAKLEAYKDYYLLKGEGRSGEDIDIEVKESDKLFVITENLDDSRPWVSGDYVEKTASGYRIIHTGKWQKAPKVAAGPYMECADDIGRTFIETYPNASIFDHGDGTFSLYDEDYREIVTMRDGILVSEAGGIVSQTSDGYQIEYTVWEEVTSNAYVTPSLTVKGATLVLKDQTYELSWDDQEYCFKTKNGTEVLLYDDYQKIAVITDGKEVTYNAYDLLIEYELHYAAKEDIVRVEKDGTLGEVSVYLPLGSYTVEEIKTPYGFLISELVQSVSFEAADQIKEIVFNTKDSSTEYTDRTMNIWESKNLQWFVGGLNTIGEKFDQMRDANFFTWGTYGDGEESFYKDKEGFINFFDLRVKAWSDEDVPKPDNSKVAISKKDITTLEELPGAELIIKDANGNEVDRWISSNKAHFVSGLEDGAYTLIEITAPDGYKVAESITFTVKDGEAIGGTVVMYDAPEESKVVISKQDITTKKELPGAKLVVTDANGNAVDSWVSEKKPHEIENLADGKYTLTEITAPDGYEKTESITFTVKDGVVFGGTVVMYDAPENKEVYISKQDLTTKEELPGAKLIVTDENGQTIDSWTSTDEVHVIKNLPDGDYTLTELTAPNGYEVAESITFKVVDGKAVGGPIVMYDRASDLPKDPEDDRHEEPAEHQWKLGVGIYKADKETKASLKGAKFGLYTTNDIYNVDGKLLVGRDSLLAVATTDETGHANFAVDIALMSKWMDENRFDDDLIYSKAVTHSYDTFIDNKDGTYTLCVEGSDDLILTTARFDSFGASGSYYMTLDGTGVYVDENAKTVTYEIPVSIDGNTAVNSGKFYIKELTPPEGYLYDDTVYDVEFKYDDEYTMYIPVYAKHANEPTKVTLNKMDLTGEEEVPGATIAIYKIKDVHDVNEDGIISHDSDNLMLIDSWVSTETAHETTGLLLSNTEWPRLPNEEERENIYIFRELIPADGYIRARDIEFKLYQKQGTYGWVDATTGESYGYEVQVRMNYCDNEYESGSIISPNEHADSWFVNKTATDSSWDYTKVLEGYTEIKWLLVNKNLVLFFHENINKETIDKILKEEDFKDLTFDTVYLEFGGDSLEIDFFSDKQVRVRPADSYLHYDQMWYSLSDIHVTMYDDVTKVQFKKQDIVTGEDVIGARLQIIDEDGNVIDSWVTTKEPHYIEGKLTAGEEYTLVETYAPTKDGYVKSNSVKFKVEDDGHIQKVVMQDDFTKLRISKADITTKEEIAGAMLEIWSTDKNGKKLELIDKWTTGDDGYDKDGRPNRHYIDYLPTGTYVLIETMAPEGYVVAEDIHFTIEETGLLHKVQMLDATRALKIYKYRTGTTQFVEGATIAIYRVPEEYVEYLTDRVQVEMDAAILDYGLIPVAQRSTEADDTNLSSYLTSVTASGTEHRELYETQLSLLYSMPWDALRNHLTFTQVLPKEISIPEEQLGKELIVKEDGKDAITFVLGKGMDGYTLSASFDEEYAKRAGIASVQFDLNFQAVIDASAAKDGKNISLAFTDTVKLDIRSKDITEIDSELTEDVLTIKLSDKDLVTTIKTKNGPVTVNDLESGWYIALETKAPNGYILDKTPQVFKVTGSTTEQSLTFYNQKKETPSGGGGGHTPSEPTPEEPTPETPTPGTEIGKLILRFKYGWDWNNIRTEDTGEKGSSILLTIESGPAVPNKVILIAALTAAALGTVSVILYRKKKKAADKA